MSDKSFDETCQICMKNPMKYTCPRCNVLYCSLECYKSGYHSNCSETFYKECIISELKDSSVSSEEKMRILRILKDSHNDKSDRYGESQDSYSEASSEHVSLEERLAGLDLDKDLSSVWAILTSEEQQEFQSLINSGSSKLSALITVDIPWWRGDRTSIDSWINGKNSRPVPKPVALCPDKIASVSSSVKCNIIEIIFSYCYVHRLYNGSLTDNDILLAAGGTFLQLATVLSESAIYYSVEACLTSIFANLGRLGNEINYTEQLSLQVLDDVCVIVNKPLVVALPPSSTEASTKIADERSLIWLLLVEVWRFLKSIISKKKLLLGSNLHRWNSESNELKRDKTEQSCQDFVGTELNVQSELDVCDLSMLPDLKTLRVYTKKIEFFLSYVKLQSDDIYFLHQSVKVFKEDREAASKEFEEHANVINDNLDELRKAVITDNVGDHIDSQLEKRSLGCCLTENNRHECEPREQAVKPKPKIEILQ